MTTPAAVGFHAHSAPSPATKEEHRETIDVIANLATTTAADRTAVANLRSTNAALVRDNAAVSGKLMKALERIAFLTQQLADRGMGRSGGKTGAPVFERKHYCWSYGYKSTHSSVSVLSPKRATRNGQRGQTRRIG